MSATKAKPYRRRLRLTIHGMDPILWAARHGITPFSAACDLCGAPCTTNLPIVLDGMRGLASPKCVCGNESMPYCVILK